MGPDHGRIVRDAKNSIDLYDPVLSNLYALCAQNFALLSQVGGSGDVPFDLSQLEKNIAELNRLWSDLSATQRNDVTRKFVTTGFEVVARCWGSDTLAHLAGLGDNAQQQRSALSKWISMFSFAIYAANAECEDDPTLAPREVQDALTALNRGQVMPLFKPSKRRGKGSKAYSLAIMKLKFMRLLQELATFNLTPQQINAIALKAVGIDRDTRRKWVAAAKAMLAPNDPARLEQDHRHFMEQAPGLDDIKQQLMRDGEAIRLALGHNPRPNLSDLDK